MKDVYKNYLYNLVYHIFAIIIPLVTTPYISRVLGASGLGDYAFAFSVASYFSLFILLGLKSYGNREIAIVRDDRRAASVKFWNIYGMQAFIGIMVSLVYFGYALIRKENVLALIMGITVIASVIDVSWFFFGQEAFKTVSVRDFITKIITVVCIFLFVKQSSDVWKYALIYSIGTIISQVLLWLSVSKYVDFVKPCWEEMKKHLIPNLILFIPIVSVHMYKTIDKIMLGLMADSEEVGFYYSSEKVVNVPLTIVSSLNTVMLPHMSFLYAKKQDGQANEKLRKSLIFSVLCSTGISACLISVASQFVPLFYGYGFEKCIGLFWVLLPCGIIISYTNVICHQYLIPNNMRKAYVYARLIGAVANIIMNAVMIPKHGALGAAIATLFTEVVVFGVQMAFAKGKDFLWKLFPCTMLYLVAGFLTVVVFINVSLNISDRLIGLCVKSVLCFVFYAIIVAAGHFVIRRRNAE